MNKSVLMHADVHKSAESGDVGNNPFQNHIRLEVF